MTEKQIVNKLEIEWAIENGFFYEVRSRKFDLEKGKRVQELLQNIEPLQSKKINKRLVQLLWYIPLFLEYQKDTLKPVLEDKNYIEYVRLVNGMQSEVERILGYP